MVFSTNDKNEMAYRIARPLIKKAQASGVSDEEIESIYGVEIRPEDRIRTPGDGQSS